MSVQKFLEETKKRTGEKGLSSAQQEIADFARLIYHSINKGETEEWVKQISIMFVKNIAPKLSIVDTIKSAAVIEGIVLTVLSRLFEEGTIVKKEMMDKK